MDRKVAMFTVAALCFFASGLLANELKSTNASSEQSSTALEASVNATHGPLCLLPYILGHDVPANTTFDAQIQFFQELITDSASRRPPLIAQLLHDNQRTLDKIYHTKTENTTLPMTDEKISYFILQAYIDEEVNAVPPEQQDQYRADIMAQRPLLPIKDGKIDTARPMHLPSRFFVIHGHIARTKNDVDNGTLQESLHPAVTRSTETAIKANVKASNLNESFSDIDYTKQSAAAEFRRLQFKRQDMGLPFFRQPGTLVPTKPRKAITAPEPLARRSSWSPIAEERSSGRGATSTNDKAPIVTQSGPAGHKGPISPAAEEPGTSSSLRTSEFHRYRPVLQGEGSAVGRQRPGSLMWKNEKLALTPRQLAADSQSNRLSRVDHWLIESEAHLKRPKEDSFYQTLGEPTGQQSIEQPTDSITQRGSKQPTNQQSSRLSPEKLSSEKVTDQQSFKHPVDQQVDSSHPVGTEDVASESKPAQDKGEASVGQKQSDLVELEEKAQKEKRVEGKTTERIPKSNVQESAEIGNAKASEQLGKADGPFLGDTSEGNNVQQVRNLGTSSEDEIFWDTSSHSSGTDDTVIHKPEAAPKPAEMEAVKIKSGKKGGKSSHHSKSKRPSGKDRKYHHENNDSDRLTTNKKSGEGSPKNEPGRAGEEGRVPVRQAKSGSISKGETAGDTEPIANPKTVDKVPKSILKKTGAPVVNVQSPSSDEGTAMAIADSNRVPGKASKAMRGTQAGRLNPKAAAAGAGGGAEAGAGMGALTGEASIAGGTAIAEGAVAGAAIAGEATVAGGAVAGDIAAVGVATGEALVGGLVAVEGAMLLISNPIAFGVLAVGAIGGAIGGLVHGIHEHKKHHHHRHEGAILTHHQDHSPEPLRQSPLADLGGAESMACSALDPGESNNLACPANVTIQRFGKDTSVPLLANSSAALWNNASHSDKTSSDNNAVWAQSGSDTSVGKVANSSIVDVLPASNVSSALLTPSPSLTSTLTYQSNSAFTTPIRSQIPYPNTSTNLLASTLTASSLADLPV